MNYGIGIGLARCSIDVVGVIASARLSTKFAPNGGGAAIAIGLLVGVITEVSKCGYMIVAKELN